MVLKRALPCASRLVPVGAPIGFSGAFSSVGANVCSAHACSEAAGWRASKTSAIGRSATVFARLDESPLDDASLDDTSGFGLFSGIGLPLRSRAGFDDRGVSLCRKMEGPTERLEVPAFFWPELLSGQQ